MYRRHVARRREGERLDSRGEDDSEFDMDHSAEIVHLEIISRLSKLPIIHSAVDYATGAYGRAKESSPFLIQKTLNTAEGTMKYAVNHAAPVIHTFEKPIHLVDSLACKTLDKVEENLPVVTKQPNEIVEDTRNYVSEKLQPVQSGVETARGMFGRTVDMFLGNSVGSMAINTCINTVSFLEDNVDHYLPPLEDEAPLKQDEVVTGEPSKKIGWCVQHGAKVGGAVWRRTWKRTQHSLHQFGMKWLVLFGGLINMLEWVQLHWKDVKLTSLPGKVRELADEFDQQMSHAGPGQESVGLIRGLSDRTKRMVSRTASTLLAIPLYFAGRTRDQMQGSLNFATNIAGNVAKISRLDRIAVNVLARFQQQFPLVYQPTLETIAYATDMIKRVFPEWNFNVDDIAQRVDQKIGEMHGEKREE